MLGSAMELAPGVRVTENIRLTRRLGEGGMASVWVAEHLTLHVEVAVKFIAPELLGTAPDLIARFNREATAVARIRSPHVVQVLDHGMTPDGTPYIVMELLEGEDLGMRLDRDGQLPAAHVVSIVSQVAKALTRAHAVGIVHRDIKPDNIFIAGTDEDEEMFVKVLDFGIAKHTKKTSYSVVTTTGTMVGTPAYMSPEQVLSGKHVDERADLWSLAVVAYHALTGDVPFQGNTLGALCVAIARGSFQPPSYVEPSLGRAMDAFMARALSLLPEERFQTPKEFAEAFREAAESVQVAKDDVGPFSRPSSDFSVGGAAGERDADDEPAAPGTGKHRRARATAMESLLVVPKTRLAHPAVLAGGVALVGGVLAVAAFTRVDSASAPSAGRAAATVLEPRASDRSTPSPMASVEASAPAPVASNVLDPAVEGAAKVEASLDSLPTPKPKDGRSKPRSPSSRAVRDQVTKSATEAPPREDGVTRPSESASPIDRGF